MTMHPQRFSHIAEKAAASKPQQWIEVGRLSADKLGVKQTEVFLGPLRHNLRTIQAENAVRKGGRIDSSRSHLNTILRGASTVKEVNQEAWRRINAEVLKVRVNACLAFELVVSLPAGSGLDEDAYFRQSLDWAESFFETSAFHAVIHRDEAAPHMHVFLMPIRDGQLVGGRLIEKGHHFRAMRDSHFDVVAAGYGLERQTEAMQAAKARRRLSPAREYSNVTTGLVAALEAYLLNPVDLETAHRSAHLLAGMKERADRQRRALQSRSQEAFPVVEIPVETSKPLIGDLSASADDGGSETTNSFPVYRGLAISEKNEPYAAVATSSQSSIESSRSVAYCLQCQLIQRCSQTRKIT